MRRWWNACVLIVVAALLSGCLDGTTEEAHEPLDPVTVTDPDDFSYMAENTTGRGHVHDYWGGEGELGVVDETKGGFGIHWEPQTLLYLPPDDAIVPQGTHEVHVTVEWDAQGVEDPELLVQTAADHELKPHGTLTSGETLVIPVSLNETDLPHQSVSAWAFGIRLVVDDTIAHYVGNIALKAVAVRGEGPLPVYPPHPDRWKNETELHLLTADFSTSLHARIPLFSICPESCFSEHRPEQNKTVPYNTRTVAVTITRHDGALGELGLLYHGADTRELTAAEPERDDGTTLEYLLPVPGGAGDSPYAQESVWTFAVTTPTHEKPANAYRGGYTIEATARLL